jgi:hypothetical protein
VQSAAIGNVVWPSFTARGRRTLEISGDMVVLGLPVTIESVVRDGATNSSNGGVLVRSGIGGNVDSNVDRGVDWNQVSLTSGVYKNANQQVNSATRALQQSLDRDCVHSAFQRAQRDWLGPSEDGVADCNGVVSKEPTEVRCPARTRLLDPDRQVVALAVERTQTLSRGPM